MEILKDKINAFLSISDGDGSGSGSGEGSSYGSGDGYGYGDGYGDGDGDGDGDGLKSINGNNVYMIDDIETIIFNVRGNVAEGAIVKKDLTLQPCYIAKEGDCFAHGDTLRQAVADAHNKYVQELPTEERIAMFIEEHPDYYQIYPAADLFEWHNTLTGSCLMGRENFCKENEIDVQKDSFTVEEFIKLTANSYGKEIILQLKETYNEAATR